MIAPECFNSFKRVFVQRVPSGHDDAQEDSRFPWIDSLTTGANNLLLGGRSMSEDKFVPSEVKSKQSNSSGGISRRSLLLGFLIAPVIALDPEPAAAQFGGLLGVMLSGIMRERGYRHRGGGHRHYASRRRSYHAHNYARSRVAHRSHGGSRRHVGFRGRAGGGGGGMGKADF